MAQELIKFDANPNFGPCKGISRWQRWANAYNLGLEPPEYIPAMIEESGLNDSYLEKYLI